MRKSIVVFASLLIALGATLVFNPGATPALAGDPCYPVSVSAPSIALCPTPIPSYEGPAIPAGWEFHYLSCSTAVFDKPAGEPVGDNAVWAGQSFYVNPEPEIAPDGTSWSQIFVSSKISPWIRTSCVKP